MRYLGLDIGTKRTGVAFADSEEDILFSLETITHDSEDELLKAVQDLVSERAIDEVVLGYPLLLSGEEGSQVAIVESFGEALERVQIPFSLLDERYTTKKIPEIDSDAAAACQILAVKLGVK